MEQRELEEGPGAWTALDDGAADEEERRWLLERRRSAELESQQRERAAVEERLDHLPFTLREASRAVDDLVARLLACEGLTSLSLTAVHALVAARSRQPVVSLAQQLRVSPQAAGRAVPLLAARGLVITFTSPGPRDARVRIVEPTQEGERLLGEVRRALVVAVSVVADSVGEDRLAPLEEVLRDLALLDPQGPLRWGW